MRYLQEPSEPLGTFTLQPMFLYIQIKLMTLRLLAQQKMLSDVKPLIKMLSLVLQNSRGVIVRQPSSYTLHRLLKFFFRWIQHPHGIYIAYLPDIKRISLSDLRKLNKFKMAVIRWRSNFKLTPFSTEWEQLLDFGVYYRVFKYARSSGVVRNNFGHCIVGKI